MADNVNVTEGSGKTIASDDVGGVQYQRVKPSFGADGSATDVSTSAPLPVELTDNNNTVAADTASIKTAVEKIDNSTIVDDNSFTPASDSVQMAGFTFDDTTPDSVDEGDAGAARMSANRNVYTQIRDAAGNERGMNVDASGRIGITIEADNAGIGGGTQYTEDDAAAANPVGNALIGVRADSLGAVTSTDGDNIAARMTNNGELYVKQTDAVPVTDNGGSLTVDGTVTANLSATDNTVLDNIDSNTDYGATTGGGTEAGALRVTVANDSTGVLSVDDNGGSLTVDNGGTFATQAEGDVAHDTADSGNPVKVGGKAKNMDGTAPGTAVAEDDRVDSIADVYGRQFVEVSHPNFWHVSADYASAQTNTTVKAAPGAGLKLYITDVVISNGATAGNITLLDGSGGTVLLELYPAVNGGMTHSFRNPIALTANTLLAITSTTVTTHSVTISGFIAP